MEKCIEVNASDELCLDKFINSYLELGYKFVKSFQIKGIMNKDKEYYKTYLIFEKPNS